MNARLNALPAEQGRVTEQFRQARLQGDMQDLLALLAPDVVFTSDGGGKATAATRPVYGADRVGWFILGFISKAPPGCELRTLEVNGAPALVGYCRG